MMTCHAALSDSGKPQRSITVITIALDHPAINRTGPSFHLPILSRELVKCKSGNMAKGSCSASTTWLNVSKSLTLLSPRIPINGTADRRFILLQFAALHQGGVQVQVMWHDCRADDTDCDIEHSWRAQRWPHESMTHFQEIRSCLWQNENLDEITACYGGHQQEHH